MFWLTYSQNFSCFNLCPLFHPSTEPCSKQPVCVFPITWLQVLGHCSSVSPQPCLLQAGRIWSSVALSVLHRCVRPLPDPLCSLSLPDLTIYTAHARQGRCSMRPRKENNRVYLECTVYFGILFLDHLQCSIVQFILIPSMVVQSLIVFAIQLETFAPWRNGQPEQCEIFLDVFGAFYF